MDTGNGKEQNHQDDFHNSFIKKSEVARILKKYGFSLNYILNDKNFPLKERALPDLCADRLDYILREGLIFKEINQAQVNEFLKNLSVKNNRWIFKNFSSAKKFARLSFKMNRVYYAGWSSAVMFRYRGFEKNKKTFKKRRGVNLLWQRMNGKIAAKPNRRDCHTRVFCKSRIVNPLFMDQGKIKLLSQAWPVWEKIVRQELKPKQYFLKFEK